MRVSGAEIAMPKEQRRAPRRAMDVLSFLYSLDGWPLGECRVKDMSIGGARLAHAISDELPDQFLLSFSKSGTVRRQCQIAWRKEKEMGVRFLTAETASKAS
jgi:hypothetical protein